MMTRTMKVGMRASADIYLSIILLTASVACAQSIDINATSQKTEFLKSIHQISNAPSITAERVSSLFGWELETPPLRISKQSLKYFFSVERDRVVRVELVENSNSAIFLIDLNAEWCVSSNDVIDVFGNRYKSLVAMYDPYPKTSAEVRRNQAKFLAGPVYRIDNKGLVTKVTFTFGLSECLQRIEVYEPRHYGANE